MGSDVVRDQRSRVACSGRARSVLDHIDRTEREERLAQRPMRTITLPCSSEQWVLMQYQHPFEPEEWDLLMKVLDVMKVGLVDPNA